MSGALSSPSVRAAAEFAAAESRELQRLTDDLARLVAAQIPPKPEERTR